MIDGLKPYPEYKDSDLRWLGKIPSHWKLKRGKSIFQRVDERSASGKEELLTVSSTKGVVPRRTVQVTMFKAESYVGYKLCWRGDLVINSLWAWAGGLGVSQHHGIVSSAYGVYRLRPDAAATSAFIHEVVRSSPFNWELQVRSKGIWTSRLQLTDESFLDAPFHLPPANEQAAIVQFLDHTNGRIERTIRSKMKLIGLLNEQKQAIIYRAVACGLDSTVPLKPSGIPSLGDIPRHWQTPLMGRCLTRIEQGWSPVAAEGELETDQWAVLTLSSVRRGVFNSSAIKPISKETAIPTDIQVRDGDILLTRSNTRDRVGDVCIVRGVRQRTLLCDLIYRLTLRNGTFVPQFLVYQLLCPIGRGQIERDARGSSGTMPKVSQGHIKSWRVLVPPITEQEKIVAHVNKLCAPLETTIESASREIALLREYSTRLTADVVTGKLDVREAARELPDTAEEAAVAQDIEELNDVEPEDVEA